MSDSEPAPRDEQGDPSGAGAAVPLHAMNATGRFSDRADDYARFRPSYPAEAIDTVLDGLDGAEGAPLRAVDLGAGTGIASRLLADRGVRVVAVETNASMRAAGMSRECEGIEWRDGRAESTGVPSGWADLIIAAQAWHWFEPVGTEREVRRVLRPHGRLAVMWNVDDPADAATGAFRQVVQTYATSPRVYQEMVDAKSVERLGWRTPVREVVVAHVQRLDAEGLIGRARSASYAPKEPEALSSMTRALSKVFDRFAKPTEEPGGSAHVMAIRYLTKIYLTARPA